MDEAALLDLWGWWAAGEVSAARQENERDHGFGPSWRAHQKLE